MHISPSPLVKIDNFCDYVPIVSTITNLVDLFIKTVILPFKDQSTIPKNHYYSHLNQKSFMRIIILLIPVLGNFIIGISDISMKENSQSFKNFDGLKTPEVISQVSSIDPQFTIVKTISEQQAAHEETKTFLKQQLSNIGAQADFISHTCKNTPKLSDIVIKQDLFSSVFSVQYTSGVLQDIINDGKRQDDNIVIYGVASQFNGCEAPGKFTIAPGKAQPVYLKDPTQGPQAQLAFSPEQIELINCGGNLGYNGLCKILNEETKSEISNGYFTPSKAKAKTVIQQLHDAGNQIEYPCIANIPLEGTKPVHQILVSAPAFGQYADKNSATGEDQDEIQFLCALNAYRAQFEKCIDLAKKENKLVTLKATAAGLGVFGNTPPIVAKAFYHAALEYQAELQHYNVKVMFQVFKHELGIDPKANFMATVMGLTEANKKPSFWNFMGY